MVDTKLIVGRGYGLVSVLIFVCLGVTACAPSPQYDLVIRNGTIFDGSGSPGIVGDVAINGDAIAAIGSLERATGGRRHIILEPRKGRQISAAA